MDITEPLSKGVGNRLVDLANCAIHTAKLVSRRLLIRVQNERYMPEHIVSRFRRDGEGIIRSEVQS
jgi:hypothetical protein